MVSPAAARKRENIAEVFKEENICSQQDILWLHAKGCGILDSIFEANIYGVRDHSVMLPQLQFYQFTNLDTTRSNAHFMVLYTLWPSFQLPSKLA